MSKLLVEKKDKIEAVVEGTGAEAVAMLTVATNAVAMKVKLPPRKVLDIVEKTFEDVK